MSGFTRVDGLGISTCSGLAKDGKIHQDLLRYPLTAFVGLVDMEVEKRGDINIFKLLENGQLQRFRSKCRNMGPVAVNRRYVEHLKRRQRDREQGTYYREFPTNNRRT